MSDHLVVFTPSGKRGQFPDGTPLLSAARSLGVDVDSVCGGRGICGRCQVKLSEGEFATFGISSSPDHLDPLTEPEKRYDAKKGLKDRRLSCHCKLRGDVVIDVPADSQVHKQVVRKASTVTKIELDPLVALYYVEVEEATMERQLSDAARLKEALQKQWSPGDLQLDSSLLANLQTSLRIADWKVTVAVYNDSNIIALYPGVHTTAYGLAVDIGSTTIAAHLTNLLSGEVLASSGVMNPQIRFGEDLMSRVSYVMMHPEGALELTTAVRTAINELAISLAAEVGISTADILDIVVVGNPVMHHLLLGIDPTPLGGAPFALATDEAIWMRASDLELSLHPAARAYLLPCVAGHVGADTAAMVLNEAPFKTDEMTLLVDVGTNAEIVLGNRHKLAACSSPTGPALEGAQISSGQRAAAGAIERVRIDKDTLEPRFKVIGSELWSNEPGFADETKQLTISGICGSGIIEVLGEMFLADIITPDGQVNGALEHPRIKKEGRVFAYQLYDGTLKEKDVAVYITQSDVRAVQLAKAALFAGVQLLMEHLKVTEIDRIALAGAFGSHIDTKYAMLLGLIPDCTLANVRSVGNAAGDGALRALLSKAARQTVETVVRQIEKIETAVEPRFQDYFVNALAIPNKAIGFPKLEAELGLPSLLAKAQATATADTGTRKRKRRRSRAA